MSLKIIDGALHEGCKGDCGGTFECDNCGFVFGYCFGGDGDELCNNCWGAQNKEEEGENDAGSI